MDIKLTNTHFCNVCNKNYKTANGLWKHNNKYHKEKEELKKESLCCYCDKKLSDRHSKWRHEKICTNRNKEDINSIKSELTKLKSELEIVKNKPSTINNINNINKGIINKGVMNFIKPPGLEDISIINEKEAERILENEMNCLITLVDYINFNEKYPENHSFCTTALNDKYISTINTETLIIEKQRKKDFFDSMLNNSLKVINMLYDKLKTKKNPKAIRYKETIDKLSDFVVVNNKGKKAYVEMMNTLSFNKRHITQTTWNQLMNNEIPVKTAEEFEKEIKELEEKDKARKELKKQSMKNKIIPDMSDSDSDSDFDSDSSTDSEKDNNQTDKPIQEEKQIENQAENQAESDVDSDSDEPIEMRVQGTMCLLDGTNLYKMTESKQKGELYGTFINGKVKKIKQSAKEIDL